MHLRAVNLGDRESWEGWADQLLHQVRSGLINASVALLQGLTSVPHAV